MTLPRNLEAAALGQIEERLRHITPQPLHSEPYFNETIAKAAAAMLVDALEYIKPSSQEANEYGAKIHAAFAPCYLMISGVREVTARAIVDQIIAS